MAVVDAAGVQFHQHREIGQVFRLPGVVEADLLAVGPVFGAQVPVVGGQGGVFSDPVGIDPGLVEVGDLGIGQCRIEDRHFIDASVEGLIAVVRVGADIDALGRILADRATRGMVLAAYQLAVQIESHGPRCGIVGGCGKVPAVALDIAGTRDQGIGGAAGGHPEPEAFIPSLIHETEHPGVIRFRLTACLGDQALLGIVHVLGIEPGAEG